MILSTCNSATCNRHTEKALAQNQTQDLLLAVRQQSYPLCHPVDYHFYSNTDPHNAVPEPTTQSSCKRHMQMSKSHRSLADWYHSHRPLNNLNVYDFYYFIFIDLSDIVSRFLHWIYCNRRKDKTNTKMTRWDGETVGSWQRISPPYGTQFTLSVSLCATTDIHQLQPLL